MTGSRRIENRFVAFSLWTDLSAHETYVDDHFATMRKRSRLSEDVEIIAGTVVPLEPRWTVPARLTHYRPSSVLAGGDISNCVRNRQRWKA